MLGELEMQNTIIKSATEKLSPFKTLMFLRFMGMQEQEKVLY